MNRLNDKKSNKLWVTWTSTNCRCHDHHKHINVMVITNWCMRVTPSTISSLYKQQEKVQTGWGHLYKQQGKKLPNNKKIRKIPWTNRLYKKHTKQQQPNPVETLGKWLHTKCNWPAGQWGRLVLGMLVTRWKSSWHWLQKWVVPKQKKTATEQQ